ncbi:MAG: hypothetical protein AAB116_12445 [Candidatus Poribacteria bacterium]
MDSSIAPLNITAAVLITQFSIVVIISIGAAILKSGDRYSPISGFSWVILFFALPTIGLLAFSDQLSDMWLPLFGNISFSGISWSIALLVMFIADTLLVTYMVYNTGGSEKSPFNAVLFMLPALAIFLRESGLRIVVYLVLVGISFSFNLYIYAFDSEWVDERRKPANLFVSLLTFVLITFIGYVTRPK